MFSFFRSKRSKENNAYIALENASIAVESVSNYLELSESQRELFQFLLTDGVSLDKKVMIELHKPFIQAIAAKKVAEKVAEYEKSLSKK